MHKDQNCDKSYYADLYLRLSKEHITDETEISESIINQQELIFHFLKSHPEIIIHDIKIDDGYSGSNFDRPGFLELLSDITSAKINCVIVKDLSRLGREYIQTGYYTDDFFPRMGVRFIAVNDHIDQIFPDTGSSLFIPVKNMINDEHNRDVSTKIRSHLTVLRSNGAYVGARVPYGYLLSPENRHRLVIDEDSAGVVKEIFNRRLDGFSCDRIARFLNDHGIDSPSEYKKKKGLASSSYFQTKPIALWSAQTVKRILTYRIYTGDLVQGKTSRPNHKVKALTPVQPEDWIVKERTHEPIIERHLFEAVQRLLSHDTRCGLREPLPHLLSGYLFCAGCGEGMVRTAVPRNGKIYEYYVCSTYKYHHSCTSHRINAEKLEQAVFAAVRGMIESALKLDEILRAIEAVPLNTYRMKQLNQQLYSKQNDLQEYQKHKASLYGNLANGVISNADYKNLSYAFDVRISETQKAITLLTEKRNELESRKNETLLHENLRYLKQYGTIKQLDRRLLACTVENISVLSTGEIDLCLTFQADYPGAKQALNRPQGGEAFTFGA